MGFSKQHVLVVVAGSSLTGVKLEDCPRWHEQQARHVGVVLTCLRSGTKAEGLVLVQRE